MNRIQNAYLGVHALLATTALFSTEAARVAPEMGLTGKVALVHKKDHEGMLQIDAFTGAVLPEQHDRPEWADGLALAQLAERHTFYVNRLGPQYADEHKSPELYAFEDLGWLGVNMETQDEITIPADDEFRMDVVAQVLGIDRETGDVKAALTETEIARDDTRTDAEMRDLLESQKEGFAATGTNGG